MKLSLCLGLLCFSFCIPKLQGAESPVDKIAGQKHKPNPKCSNPRGNVGDSLLNGCDKRTCIQIKNKADWHKEFAYESCCWQNQTAYKIGETFSTSKDPDTGIDTTMRCDQTSSGSPHIVVDVSAENCNIAEQVNEISESVKQTNNELQVTNSKIENIENKLQVTNSKVGNIEKLLSSVLHIIQTGESKTTTTQTTPTTTKTSFPIIEGVLIAGSWGIQTSSELFLPNTGKTCDLQSMPTYKTGHSLDGIGKEAILCGGGQYGSLVSCFQFLQTSSTGSWAHYATLAQSRYRHTTHVFKGEKDVLMLVGGHTGPRTTEILGSGRQYDLVQDTYEACSIPDQSTYILTGGKNSLGYLKSVVRYDIKGFVENLPELPKAIANHGCGFYMDKTNTKVLVVAGGAGSAGTLSSTELLPSGATSWISGEALPWALTNLVSVPMDNHLLIIGGYSSDGSRREILMFDGNWTEVGNMRNARSSHKATKIEIGDQLDISACL